MMWVDQHGRLFGRINLIDAAIVVVLIACLPLGYSAWALFRQPTPIIDSIEPATVAPLTEARLRVEGRYLRPYLQVIIGPSRGQWLWQDLEYAEIAVPPTLPTGLYDIRLYDEAMEIGRYPKALRVHPLQPQTEIEQLIDRLDSYR